MVVEERVVWMKEGFITQHAGTRYSCVDCTRVGGRERGAPRRGLILLTWWSSSG
jgi:hypothetical protein